MRLNLFGDFYKSPNWRQVLASLYEADVDEPAQQIQMTFEYLEQEGVHLPAGFGSKSQDPGGTVSIPAKFDHYQIGRP